MKQTKRTHKVINLIMLSIIIPTLNDAENLSKALAQITSAAKNFDIELIVADGGSTDSSMEVALSYGATLIKSERGRGTQISSGINSSSGSWLLILHADTLLGLGWITVVKRFIKNPSNRFNAGHFIFGLDDNSNKARILEKVVLWRSTFLGTPYGDQGLLINRDFYNIIGGYPRIPIMEDIEILRKIKSSRLKQLPVVAKTSASRYKRDGYLYRSLKNFTCRLLYFFGASESYLVKLYNGENIGS